RLPLLSLREPPDEEDRQRTELTGRASRARAASGGRRQAARPHRQRRAEARSRALEGGQTGGQARTQASRGRAQGVEARTPRPERRFRFERETQARAAREARSGDDRCEEPRQGPRARSAPRRHTACGSTGHGAPCGDRKPRPPRAAAAGLEAARRSAFREPSAARAAATATPGDVAPGAAATGTRFRPGFTGIDRRAEGRGRTGCGSHSRRPGGLTDPELRCSGEQLKSWCQQWIGPSGYERAAGGLDYERVGRSVSERVAQEGGATPESVPTRALKRLRLRRHMRTPPRGFSVSRSENLAPQQAETVDMCTALVEAARRWYARSACHDTVVQANLARLAVLR